jgi:hypothetical protein
MMIRKRPLQTTYADAVKFLELLLSECSATEHSWRRCRRCLAFAELEGHQPLARSFIQAALDALKATDLSNGCATCNLDESDHCDLDEPGVDHYSGCPKMHHEFIRK